MYTYIPYFGGLPPIPAPLGHHRAPRWECSFEFNDYFWWSYPLAVSSSGYFPFPRHILYNCIFVRALSSACSPNSPPHFLLFLVILHMTNLYAFFEPWLNNFLWNFSWPLKTEPIRTHAPKLTLPVALYTCQVWLLWHSFVITLNLNISP